MTIGAIYSEPCPLDGGLGLLQRTRIVWPVIERTGHSLFACNAMSKALAKRREIMSEATEGRGHDRLVGH